MAYALRDLVDTRAEERRAFCIQNSLKATAQEWQAFIHRSDGLCSIRHLYNVNYESSKDSEGISADGDRMYQGSLAKP